MRTPEAVAIAHALQAAGCDGAAYLLEGELRTIVRDAFRAGRRAQRAEDEPFMRKPKPKPPPSVYRRR